MDVSTNATAEKGYLDAAARLHISTPTLEVARGALASVERPWLLILDNADDPDVDYQQYIPSGEFGVVLITSRNPQCNRYATVSSESLEKLDDAAARQLLLTAAEIDSNQHDSYKEDAQKVSALLSSHALALIQAGSYVSRGHCTLQEYPSVYERQRKRLLKFRPAQAQSRYRDVYTTFEASAESLKSSGTEAANDALQLLSILAMLGPNQLPQPLFQAVWEGAQRIKHWRADDDDIEHLDRWHSDHLLPLIQCDEDEWESFRLVEAISSLKSFSLITVDVIKATRSISMHPLTHSWAKDRQDPEKQKESWLTAGCMVAFLTVKASRCNDWFWKNYHRQLRPHLQAVMLLGVPFAFTCGPQLMIVRILYSFELLLWVAGEYHGVLVLGQAVFEHLGLDQRVVNVAQQALYLMVAFAYNRCGGAIEALHLLEQSLKLLETLAENNMPRLLAQQELAIAYQNSGQIGKAVSLLEQVNMIRKQMLPEDDPDLLSTQYELARAYLATGRAQEALSLMEQVVEIHEQTLEEDIRNRLVSEHELARLYWGMNRQDDALKLMEHVIKIRQQVLKGTELSRLKSEDRLATWLWETGHHNTAFEMMEHVFKIRQQVLDENDPIRRPSEKHLQLMTGETAKPAESRQKHPAPQNDEASDEVDNEEDYDMMDD